MTQPGERASWPNFPNALPYFAKPDPMPGRCASEPGAYILLSDPYGPDAAEAAARGWPVIELPGAHLDIVTHPAAVAEALLDLTSDRLADAFYTGELSESPVRDEPGKYAVTSHVEVSVEVRGGEVSPLPHPGVGRR